MEEINSCLDKLVELARAEFGERQTKFIGYRVGDIYDGFSEEIESIEEVAAYPGVTSKDIENIKKLFHEDQIYYCEDGITVIQCAHEVLNKGWRQELTVKILMFREDEQ